MSITLMSEVWKSDLPPTDKMVLLALADAANDDGVTWMALESRDGVKLDLMKKTSLSRRAVQGALKRLCDAGYLGRVDRPGKGVIWTVKGCTSCAPQEMHPSPQGVREMHRRGARRAPGGAADAPKPSTNHHSSEANASSVGRAGNDNGVTASVNRQRASKFVPESWAPTATHIAKAEELGVDLMAQVDLFRLHEFKDAKSDFDRAFHRWLRTAATNFNRGLPHGQHRPANDHSSSASDRGGSRADRDQQAALRVLARRGLLAGPDGVSRDHGSDAA